jgi:hypothetical protein
MNNKLLCFASLLAALNLNAVELGPEGSGIEFGGFLDLFYQSQDTPAGASAETLDVSQIELNLDFATGPVAVSIDYDIYSTEGGTEGADLEEAIVTYDFGNGFSMTAGKMLSYLGFEAYDAPDMYQYSYAYDAVGGAPHDIYDRYDDGISLDYANDSFSIGIFSSAETNGGYEYALAYTGVEQLTVKAIMADWDAYETTTLWGSYQFSKLLAAVEVAEKDYTNTATADIEGWLVMGNYSLTEAMALTVRYSEEDVGTDSYEKITISPSYVFNDNFSGLIEYSTYDESGATATNIQDLFAIELIYTW